MKLRKKILLQLFSLYLKLITEISKVIFLLLEELNMMKIPQLDNYTMKFLDIIDFYWIEIGQLIKEKNSNKLLMKKYINKHLDSTWRLYKRLKFQKREFKRKKKSILKTKKKQKILITGRIIQVNKKKEIMMKKKNQKKLNKKKIFLCFVKMKAEGIYVNFVKKLSKSLMNVFVKKQIIVQNSVGKKIGNHIYFTVTKKVKTSNKMKTSFTSKKKSKK